MNIKDFKAGQVVYVELTGNASREKTPEQCIEEWEITSVGRKYIKAGKWSDGRICEERTFEYREGYKRFVEKTDYCIDYIIYLTRQEIEEKHEKSKLFQEIEQRFRYGSQRDISLEQLRAIESILKEEQMTGIEFLKTIREICDNRCNKDFEDEKEEYSHCPFPWRFCDLDKNFYDMTDDELEEICKTARDFKENFQRK